MKLQDMHMKTLKMSMLLRGNLERPSGNHGKHRSKLRKLRGRPKKPSYRTLNPKVDNDEKTNLDRPGKKNKSDKPKKIRRECPKTLGRGRSGYITTGKDCLESTEEFDDGSSMSPALSPPEEICEILCPTSIDHANKFSHDLYSSTPNIHKDSSINEDELCHSFLTSHSDEPCNVSCPETADSPSLLIESENSVTPPSFPSGRVICDIDMSLLKHENWKTTSTLATLMED
ncbi:hypothetical protein JTE90_020175 [Oedothorax gibbosus]|uniref:Uncharacterized protein n=1 Tax=Oedothorax gibbosus TaxID=931172 RepID=A0AAV6TYK0_9ARAC|nr:hypothetical protein JTE90_020175 [Oedothorax gibbosus]